MSDVRVASNAGTGVASSTGPRYVSGEVIADKYRLERMLGEGGMGSVWVAKNLPLDIQVALKLIRSDLDNPDAGQRLLTEARAAARLKHPSIVRVFDFGRTRRGDPFIVMELLTGETLGDLLDREGRIAATFAVQLLLPIADALVVAHGKKVIHRDLKPENVFLATSDERLQPKVVDFGIAKFERHLSDDERKLTQAGTVLGSPDYMSPEQARGADVDRRSDIWAFCIVLYETITGRVPFEESNYHALLRRIIEDPVKPILDYAAGDVELWAILERGLQKDPADRWQNMRDLGEALALWLFSHGVTEDVYGQSLRATWLDSPGSSPGFRMSSPRFSVTDMETIRPTTAAAQARVRPPTPTGIAPAPRRKSWVLGAVAVSLLAAGAIVWGDRDAALRRRRVHCQGPPRPAPPHAASAAPPAQAQPPASATASAVPVAAAGLRAQRGRPRHRARRDRRRTSSSPPAAATPTAKPPPAHKAHKDDEDLGF